MKLSKEMVEQRENFVAQAVRANPKITGDQLQELLHMHFGKRMRIGRLYAVKNKALEAINRRVS